MYSVHFSFVNGNQTQVLVTYQVFWQRFQCPPFSVYRSPWVAQQCCAVEKMISLAVKMAKRRRWPRLRLQLPTYLVVEEWRRLCRHLIRRPGRRRWGRGLSPRSRSVIREPAEHSKRVSSREATGRCLGVELLKAVPILRFCLPEQLFLILSSLQCC